MASIVVMRGVGEVVKAQWLQSQNIWLRSHQSTEQSPAEVGKSERVEVLYSASKDLQDHSS